MNLRSALTSLVVVSLLASTAVAGTAGSATSTDQNPAVQSPLLFQQEGDGNGTVTLNHSIYEVNNGETATMNLSLSGLDSMTVQIGGGQADYKLNATVEDGNGDGQVVLLFDTAKAGSGDGSALTTKSDGDTVSVKNETKVDGKLNARMYGLTIYSGTGENVPVIKMGGLDVQGDSTTTQTTTTEEDSSGETTTTTTTTESTDSGGQPGFGVGLAVTALAGVALLARRR